MPSRLSRRRLLQTATLAAECGAVSSRDAAADNSGRPDWVKKVTRMAFLSPDQLDEAARAGVQVVQTNVLWPYYPLRRDGGGPPDADARRLEELAEGCRRRRMRLVLGLPPFPPVALVRAHPDWRVQPGPDGSGGPGEPKDDDLGTRLGCNVGPWGDYLIAVCKELVADFGLSGFSFDGNYHAPICFCRHCAAAYRRDEGSDLPARVDLDDPAYRRYLDWRGRRLEDHYRRLRAAIRAASPDAAVITWSVNAGRYGHFLHTPRAMPTTLNRQFDMPMQEWWLDETNLGASVMPAFGAAYLRAVAGDGPCASEPYLMSRGNPHGTHSFPRHERLARTFLAMTHGCVAPQSFGWPGHRESTAEVFAAIARRERRLVGVRRMPWAGMLVSEQTRQFHCRGNPETIWLPPMLGWFRAALEEHLPLMLLNDWDLEKEVPPGLRALILPGSAALDEAQATAIRAFVDRGGGLICTGVVGVADRLGNPRPEPLLGDLSGVSGAGAAEARGAEVTSTLSWDEHPIFADQRLTELVPGCRVILRAPLLRASPAGPATIARVRPENSPADLAAVLARQVGRGRVVTLLAGIDHAYWSYSFPYQRRLLSRCLEWAAGSPPDVALEGPMCVQAGYFLQGDAAIVHLFNSIDTAAGHGRPGQDVPLREETVPVAGLRLRFRSRAPRLVRVEPEGRLARLRRDRGDWIADLPPLPLHYVAVADF